MVLSEDIIQHIEKYTNICVLTGAGVSAESGVPTFRGAQGIWSSYRPEDLSSLEGFRRDPKLVWEWYRHRRAALKDTRPNPGHMALAEWETLADQFTLVTQNVDGLHRMAGSGNILELHGNIRMDRCMECGAESAMNPDQPTDPLPKCSCGGLLRPAVVWFGESLPEGVFESACEAAEACELFITAGTSGLVNPAATLPVLARRSGAVVIEVNIEETAITHLATYHFRGPSGDIIPALLAAWKSARFA